MRILHVTDCYAGGVSRAIDSIAKLLPDCEHSLVFDGDEHPVHGGAYTHIEHVAGSKVSKLFAINRLIRKREPDVVHAHSSWAGMYTRLLPHSIPVVYQPHCFVFDDPWRSSASKIIYRTAEKLLSLRAATILTLTPHETQLAIDAGMKSSLIELPNVPSISESAARTRGPEAAQFPLQVAMVGRLARQKDPDFFARLAQGLRDEARVRFTWIGDGERDYRDRLEQAGVRVTGWRDEVGLIAELASSDIYFHSAGYEGYPLSVLDAAAMDCAVIVRDIPPFAADEFPKVCDVKQAEALLRQLCVDPSMLPGIRKANVELFERMNRKKQREVLLGVYRSLLK